MLDEIKGMRGDKEWQERIMRRSTAFFLIAKAWVDYVQRTIFVINEVVWEEIPGYC